MKDSSSSKSSGWAMRPPRHSRTRPRLMANKGRRSKLWSALQKRETCLGGKKISFGPGSSICTKPCCSSTKDGILKPGGSVLQPLLSSINRHSPGKPYSRICCSRASLCRWETRRKHKRRQTNRSRDRSEEHTSELQSLAYLV